jgi:hypothetical protein
MMMQMLSVGGMPLLTDQIRAADPDNPRGYYEYAPVKKLKSDRDWLPKAEGKAVKIIAQLLDSLPSGHVYRVLFMERNIEEVVASQGIMLKNRGAPQPRIPVEQLARAFENQLVNIKAWLGQHPDFDTLFLPYRTVVEHPMDTAHSVNQFLDLSLDSEEMAASVNKALYRNRR